MSVLQPVSQPAEVVVRARSLTKVYGRGRTEVHALKGVDVALGRAEFTAIMGPSGSGKSTLMHCLAGLDSITDGDVELAGAHLGRMSERQLTKLRRQHVGFIFQSFNLIPTLSAEENIKLPADIAKRRIPADRLRAVAEAMGIADRLSHRPAEMSGGEQQRVACARAMVTDPEVIFADEPTGNLDSKAGLQILRLLRQAVDDLGQTVVMVTHDPQAAAWADRVLFLTDGQVVAEVRNPDRELILDALRELTEAAEDDSAPLPADAPLPEYSPSPAEDGAARPAKHRASANATPATATPASGAPGADAPNAPAGETRETADETEQLVAAAQRVLSRLPGSVIPEDADPLTGAIPVVPAPDRERAAEGEPSENRSPSDESRSDQALSDQAPSEETGAR